MYNIKIKPYQRHTKDTCHITVDVPDNQAYLKKNKKHEGG